MDFAKLCINCMKEKNSAEEVCPYCHYDPSTYELVPYALPPLEVLNGRYLTGKVIGKGGFGITYIAMDMVLERVVAIKEFFVQGYMFRETSASTSISVSRSVGESQEQYYRINREKFEREAKIIAQLGELPGIVNVYDFFYENETVYMVLEYLDGINLKEYVKKNGGRLPAEEIIKRLFSVMESLQCLHVHDIIHRDISPDNIMALKDGTLKLLDFGGAKVQVNNASSSMVIAKKGYTPIEQYHTDGHQGAWTDVYAMAATIYYCITGQVPLESVIRVENDTLKKPSELDVKISRKLESAIMKGLSVKGQNRYQSMKAFQQALEDALDIDKKKRTPGWKIMAAVAATAVVGLSAAAVWYVQTGKPVLDIDKVPQKLDQHTIFTETNPLVLTGRNLGNVDSLYINGEKPDDLKILEQTDTELKVAFSLPKDAEEISLHASQNFMGILPVSSKNAEIELYESEDQPSKINRLSKNGREIVGEEIRINEPFTLSIPDLREEDTTQAEILVNGEKPDHVEYKKDDSQVICNADIGQEIIDKINEDGKMEVQICRLTEEGYETDQRSSIEVTVNERLVDNSWVDILQGDNFQIVDFDMGIENTEEAVESRISELYDQGVRLFRYTPSNGVSLEYALESMKKREDMYLVLNLSGDIDMKEIYDRVIHGGGDSLAQRVIAMLDSSERVEEWVVVNKVQDALKILFKADYAGMTYRQMLNYWTENNIRAVSFSMGSYWSNVNLRNREEVTATGVSFFCDTPVNVLEAYNMLHPEEFEEGTPLTGVRGILTGIVTPFHYQNSQEMLAKAKYFRDMADGSSMKEYLNALSTSGYTVLISIKDDGKDVENISQELNALGVHSSVIGADDAFRNAYVAVTHTHTDGTPGDLVLEQSKSSSDGIPLEFDYVSEQTGRQFHLKSNGRMNDTDEVSPVAEISCNGINYAPNTAGINIVVYDEENDCIIDRVSFDTWNNQGNTEPLLSKGHGKEWTMMAYDSAKNDRKALLIEYFDYFSTKKEECLFILAVADEGSSNIDADIKAAMAKIGITAPFETGEGFQKSYVGLFADDTGEINFTNGANDEFSDIKISLNGYNYDGRTIDIISEGHGLEDSLAQIVIDGEEMTNELRGLHIIVYDKTEHRPVNYAWIDCYDNLKFNSINLE